MKRPFPLLFSLLFLSLTLVGLCAFYSPQSARLTVTVFDAKSGLKTPGVSVSIYASEEAFINGEKRLFEEQTNRAGTASFNKLAPKAYYIHAQKGPKKASLTCARLQNRRQTTIELKLQ